MTSIGNVSIKITNTIQHVLEMSHLLRYLCSETLQQTPRLRHRLGSELLRHDHAQRQGEVFRELLVDVHVAADAAVHHRVPLIHLLVLTQQETSITHTVLE